MASLGNRINELIGDSYSTIASNSKVDLINSAINEVADILPAELLLKYVQYKTNITGAGLDNPEEKKILMVAREIDDSSLEVRECKGVPFNEFLRAQNDGSLYEATAESPVYTYDITTATDPKIKIAPEPTANQLGYVWHFNYVTADQTSNSVVDGLPDSCLQAVVLKACINLLLAYISDFVQDEEDSEMQGMLNAQVQSLSQMYEKEISRFKEPDGTPRGE